MGENWDGAEMGCGCFFFIASYTPESVLEQDWREVGDGSGGSDDSSVRMWDKSRANVNCFEMHTIIIQCLHKILRGQNMTRINFVSSLTLPECSMCGHRGGLGWY